MDWFQVRQFAMQICEMGLGGTMAMLDRRGSGRRDADFANTVPEQRHPLQRQPDCRVRPAE